MKKINQIILFSLLILILITSLLAFLYVRNGRSQGELTAHISLDGKEIHTILLGQVTEAYTLRIDTSHNGYNLIEVSPNHIRIIESNCPDQLCIKHGEITPDSLPAVCLPHSLIIEVTGRAEQEIDTFTY